MLEELETVKKRAPGQDKIEEVVLLVHGLFRTKESMSPIVEQWEATHGVQSSFRQSESGPTKSLKVCVPISYASTRTSIDNHAEALRELAENLPGEPRISFVGHSLGNIVFRRAIGEWQTAGDPRNVLPRLKRAVMLGPPNHGSAFAASLSKLGVFETLTGASGMHLGPAWDKLQSSLGTPPCPFAIVVGDISGSYLSNPLLEGPSDGIVTVEEAQLAGAAETKTFPVLHSFLMSDPEIVKSTLSFLGGGSL
jgi:pimeloyl-ACP methyl ester carboxylesterase